jgi:signal transduction histidine kinase
MTAPDSPDDVTRLKNELEAVRRLSQTLFQKTNVDELVEAALQSALKEVDAEAGSVLLADTESKKLVFRYSVGDNPVTRGTAIPWDKGIAGSVFQSGEPAIIADVKKAQLHFGEVKSGFVTRDMITLPLKQWEGDPIGVMNILNKRNGTLNTDDMRLLTIISAFAAISIQQARLFEEAKLAEVVHRLGDLGHDLKNLLTPIVMGSQILKDEIAEVFEMLRGIMQENADKRREICEDVIRMLQDGAQRTQDRVREIADCVKGLSSPPNFASCNVKMVAESVIKTLRVLADEKGITLSLKDLETLPVIMADERRLFNAIYNLVNNAIPEVPSGGCITVSGKFDAKAQNILLSVADTGRGMSPEVRESLFSTRAISGKAGGTGLGTKIVKDVVDAHGGEIWVESEEGAGTTFHIRLPICPLGSAILRPGVGDTH